MSDNDTKEKVLSTFSEHEDDVNNRQAGMHKDLRSEEDSLPVWQSVRRYKLLTLVGMLAAFSASLDGYQITLNGGIVSNKGFIRQFANAHTTILNGSVVAAWGGIQSAGQAVGQIFLQFATDRFGRKIALWILWVFLAASILAESLATKWEHWLVAKLFSGAGVGMLQSTMPLYLCEIAPTQLRGFLITAYSFWFVIGQLFGAVALNELHQIRPLDFRLAIYTQWAMIGAMAAIFLYIPESPWYLVGRNELDKAKMTLLRFNAHIDGYDVDRQIGIMVATVEHEQELEKTVAKEQGLWAVFKGRNGLRLLIAAWPKIVQQFVGLTVFNTYSTYFFQAAGNKNPFLVTVILTCCQILSMILTSVLTDRFGRRPLTVYPYAITVIAVLCLGIVGCFNYKDKALSSLLVFFACLATFSTTGASAIGYAYATEVPQQRLRARTAGWGLAISNMVGIVFSNTVPIMIHGSANWGVKTGFFFAGTGTIAVAIAWLILPELARRTPAEIDELFEKKVNLRKFGTYITDVETRAQENLERRHAKEATVV